MMEDFPNFLSTSSSSSTSLSLHQMLISRASELAGIHGAGQLQQPPGSGGFPVFRDVSADDMSIDGAKSMRDDAVSLSRSFHVVDGSAGRKGVDGLAKNVAVAGTGTGTGTEPGRGDFEKKKKTRSQRYAFQTRSRVDILDDGYRWRKYGQKAVKNNKFPRSYYRCTHQSCKVKKQVQRLTRDEGVVVTTYEGIHSHPIENSTDNFEHILSQMQIYTSY